jgi:hypothetical protein
MPLPKKMYCADHSGHLPCSGNGPRRTAHENKATANVCALTLLPRWSPTIRNKQETARLKQRATAPPQQQQPWGAAVVVEGESEEEEESEEGERVADSSDPDL